jgi:tetratricopeptide (TPR) repeat protein
MKGKTGSILFPLLLLVPIIFVPALSFGGSQRTVAATLAATTIADIQAQELPAGFLKSAVRAKDNQYIRDYNRTIEYYNAADFPSAIPILRKLATRYRDGGAALYLWRLCMAEDFSKKNDYGSAIAYYKAALFQKKEVSVLHNTVYCYLQLAGTLKKPERVPILLHGYRFIKAHNLRDGSLGTLAIALCNNVLTPPLYEWFEAVIPCIKEAVAQADDAYLHQSLGMIYLYQDKGPLAKAEFKRVLDNYPDSEFYVTCLERYNNIGDALYRYRAVYPLQVIVNPGKISSLTAKATLLMPQSYAYQTTRALRVTLNGQNIPYQIARDDFGTQFISLEMPGRLRAGENRLAVECQVAVTQKRFTGNSLANIKIGDYRQHDARFKALTQSTGAINLRNPEIRRMAAEIRQSVKGEQLINRVQAVYQYVIKAMSYRLSGGNHEDVGVQRALRHMQSAVCEDYAVITVALLRSLQIPAGYFSGDSYGSPLGHAWTVFYTPDYQPLPLDTTSGDTSEAPDLFFLATSSVHVTDSFSCESNIMPANCSINLNTTAGPGVQVQLGEVQVDLKRL